MPPSGIIAYILGLNRRKRANRVTLLMNETPHPHLETPFEAEEIRRASQSHALTLDTQRLIEQEAASSHDWGEALCHLVEAARRATGARYAAIGVVQDKDKKLFDLVTAGFSSAEQEEFEASSSRAEMNGILRLLLERNEPLRLQTRPDDMETGATQSETFLGVPLRCGATTLGVLYLTNKRDGEAFTEDDETQVQGLGAQAAFAIYNLHALQRERALVTSLLEAHDAERRVIAYDLHDGLTQYVMAAHVHLEAFEYSNAIGKAEKAARDLAAVSEFLKKAVVESRRLINGLNSFVVLKDLGLAGALELLLRQEHEYAGWTSVEFSCNLADWRFEETFAITVYRIAQEAITNVRKHAHSKRIQVVCRRETDAGGQEQLLLEVRDEGCGFDSQARAQVLSTHDGIGLFSMAERARALGGSFDCHSVPGEGALVRAFFPFPEDTEEVRHDA